MAYPDDFKKRAIELYKAENFSAPKAIEKLREEFPKILKMPVEDTIREWAKPRPVRAVTASSVAQFFKNYPARDVVFAIEAHKRYSKLRAQYAPNPPIRFHHHPPEPDSYERAIVAEIRLLDADIATLSRKFDQVVESGNREDAHKILDDLVEVFANYTTRQKR